MGYGLWVSGHRYRRFPLVLVIVIVIVKYYRLNYCPKDERMRDSACA